MKSDRYKFFFFDMDGLLFDTERLSARIIMRKNLERGFFLSLNCFERVTGCNYAQVLKIVQEEAGKEYPYDEIWAETEAELKEMAEQGKVPLKKGAIDLLKQLHKDKKICWLVTSSNREMALALLQGAKIDGYFAGITTGECVPQSKPHPAIYRYALKAAKAQAFQTIAFEDSTNGAQSAIDANIATVVVPEKGEFSHSIIEQSVAVVNSLTDVLEGYKMTDTEWYPLDNAGKIFPATLTHRRTSLFRVSATLKSPINLNRLQKALDHLMTRCPYFDVRLQAGFFWYYFEKNNKKPIIQPETHFPCMNFNVKRFRQHLFRVMPYKNRISVEFSHGLTDGTGAIIFLKSLVAEYLELSGFHSQDKTGILVPGTPINPREIEDSFKAHFNKNVPTKTPSERAFHFPKEKLSPGQYRITTGIASINTLKTEAKKWNCTITEYLTAQLLDTYQTYFNSLPKIPRKLLGGPIIIRIPVNLRNMFPSPTMLNFFLAVNAKIDPRLGFYPFQELVNIVKAVLITGAEPKNISQQIARNVRGELSFITKIMPLCFKNFVLKAIYNIMGDNKISCGISNLGKVSMPKEYTSQIERFDFYPPPALINKINCSIVAWHDKINISFGNLSKSSKIEQIFFRKLVQAKIPILIESNDQEFICPTVQDAE